MLPGAPQDAESCTVDMYIAHWEVRPDGRWLRGEDDAEGRPTENTWLRESRAVTIQPAEQVS